MNIKIRFKRARKALRDAETRAARTIVDEINADLYGVHGAYRKFCAAKRELEMETK